jgi:hypothetical protein
MRSAGSLLVLIAGVAALGGCAATCPTQARLETPEETIATFREAFVCDRAIDVEYRCFSDDVKQRFGGLPAYSMGRQILRQNNPGLALLLRITDLEARTKITTDPDGVHALARVDGGDVVLEIELVFEPEYTLYPAIGKPIRGFATCVVEKTGAGEVTVRLIDTNLKRDLSADADLKQRVDIRPRWVIAHLPQLKEAIQATRGGRDPKTLQE